MTDITVSTAQGGTNLDVDITKGTDLVLDVSIGNQITLAIDKGYAGETGASGFSGYSGYSGFSGVGTQGVSGISGYSGYSGAIGQSGLSGYSGASGYSGSGISGFSGYSGSVYIGTSPPPTYGAGSMWWDDVAGKLKIYYVDINGGQWVDSITGTAGASGYSGISGFSGMSGFSGYSGSGISGYSGSGVSGFSGYSGQQGTSGFSGFSGQVGASGFSGISGYSGYSGTSGFSGSGVSGYSGVNGLSGYSGQNGQQGTSGFSGFSGYSGAVGQSGISGYSGVSGTSGFSGTSGYSGYSGAVGATGESSSFFPYRTDTGATSGQPADGLLLWNNATQINATQINVNHRTENNVDIDIFLSLLQPSETFTIQDRSISANAQTWIITGTPTNINAGTVNSYWTIPVSLVSSKGTGTTNFPDNHEVILALVSGVSGYSGFSGYSGYSGAQGTSGFSGYSGEIGASGFSGESGYSGYSGSGISGYSGFSGINGTSGISGFSGANGVSGLSGFSGQQGESGFSGISGYSGFSGTNGTNGTNGESGISGYSGYSGYSGFSGSGISGYSGEQGISGFSGYSGINGTNGASGISGYSGFSGSGISGFSGYSGTNGASGISGFSGYSGFSGSGISGFSGFSGAQGQSGFSGFSGFSGATGTGGTPASPVNSVQYNNAGAFGGSADLTFDGNQLALASSPTNTVAAFALTGTPNNAVGSKVGVLSIGPNFSAADKNILATFIQDINDYTQVIIQNQSIGTAASADFIVNNDNTSGAGVFGDFGINSSTYSGAGALGTPNATYLYSNGGDLAIATATAHSIRFSVNGNTVDDVTIDPNGRVSISNGLVTTTPTAILHLGAGSATASTAPFKFTAGTLLTTPETGAFEFDANDLLYFTNNPTNGRGYIPSVLTYRLLANGSNTATAISPFFGANSSIPLEANGTYEIEIECYYIKNTAGTLVWTITNSATVTNMAVNIQTTPIAGYTAVPTASAVTTGALVNQTAAAVAFGATGSLANNSNHITKFKIILQNASSTSVRLNVTNSAGTITPIRNSYWKATKILNTGIYAA